MSDPVPCSPLFKLSPELRLQIYTHLLTFPTPIHLRQHIPGTPHTALLRTNRQIQSEARAVLYDSNTISLSRNDFCLYTDPMLQTPVQTQHVRHLRFTSFGESLACNFLLERCAVCRDDARGLLGVLAGMPVLRSVTIDYSTQIANFMRFRQLAADEGGRSTTGGLTVTCGRVGMYRVRGAGMDQVDLTFAHRPLASMWPDLATLSRSSLSDSEEETALARLRAQDPDVPDELWLMWWAAQHGHLAAVLGEQAAGAWVEESELVGMDGEERDAVLHGFTVMLQTFLKAHTAVQCRRFLHALRESVGV
ncbi:hypothetical protein LTR29_001536 [Friedmanniomyces endolithicus]|nr:hypothetical protein LTR29_001536 [Friedmanniomyces endolithicus]